MKRILLFVLFALCMQGLAVAATDLKTPTVGEKFGQMSELQGLSPEMMQLGLEKFTKITPAQYREMTGKKLGLKNTVALKMAQHKVKKQMKQADGSGISSGVYVLLAIFGLGWLAMGLLSDWEGNDWIINLVLSLLCWLPGLIHALIKKKDYF